MAKVAVIIGVETDGSPGAFRPLLGLTVGERLMRTLAKGGITHVVFAGTGPLPPAVPGTVQITDWAALSEVDGPVAVLPSDLVLDPGLLDDSGPLPEALPIQRILPDEVPALLASPERFAPHLAFGNAKSGKGFAVRVTDDTSAKAAARCLMLSLHKAADGIVSRHLNRKISTFISKRLAPLPIRPNHITTVVFLIGIASFPLAFLGTRLGFALGGFCYWFSAVLDGCDGEISRLKYQGSPLGAWLDTVVDDLVCLAYIAGMYYGLDRNVAHPYWYYLGIVAVVFFLLTIFPRYYVMARRGSGDYQKLAKAIRPEEAIGLQRLLLQARDIVFRTDFLPFAGMVTAVIGFPQVFAVPFAVGAVVSAVDALHTVVKTRRPATE